MTQLSGPNGGVHDPRAYEPFIRLQPASVGPEQPQDAGSIRIPGGGELSGSAEVARIWLEAMARGEWQGAYNLSSPELEAAATDAAVQSNDPPYELAARFFQQALGGHGFTDGSYSGVEQDPASGADVASFSLVLDNTETVTLQLYVNSELLVSDFR